MNKQYPKYKYSGLAWIGNIPADWKKNRNKNIFTPHYQAVGNGKYDLLSLTKNGVVKRDMDNGKGKFPKEFDKYNVVYPNQMIFCLFDIDETPRTVGLSNYHGMITNAYDTFKINTNIVDPQYILYYYIAKDDEKALKGYYSGLRKTIKTGLFLQIPIFLPPLPIQSAIVSFLEAKTSLIDNYIDKKQKEIELLKEYKKALIAKVVTKGIDKNAKMKPSGISWIGNIPEDWEVKKFKNFFDERVQKGFPNEQPLCSTQKYGVIPQSLYENRVVVVNKDFDKLKLVKIGDFVISLRSFQGGIEYAYYQGIISQAYTILKIRDIAFTNYIKYLFKSFNFIQLLQTCVTGIREGQNINYSLLREKYIPLPPVPVQSAIVSYLDEKTSKIDVNISNIEKQILSLKDYKQKLIADVVTGKIMVE